MLQCNSQPTCMDSRDRPYGETHVPIISTFTILDANRKLSSRVLPFFMRLMNWFLALTSKASSCYVNRLRW